MIYSSFDYVFIFLPIVLLIFFGLGGRLPYSARLFILFLGSICFYTYWLPAFLVLLLWTVVFNYFYGNFLKRSTLKRYLALGIIIDLLPLLFFKYTNFLIYNLNAVFHFCNQTWNIASLPLILPLGISFFTFQAIAYLADCYQKKTDNYTFLEFGVFIVFWPQLIAGPILHHTELIPQLRKKDLCRVQSDNLILGCSAFVMGAAKKLLLADKLSTMADYGF